MTLLDSTVAQYRSLRLSATAGELATLLARAEANKLSYLNFAQSLIEHEINARSTSRVSRNLKQAQFPSEKHLEAFDYRHQTTITKRQVSALLDFGFIDNRDNLVFLGPTGWARPTWPLGLATRLSRLATRSCSGPLWHWELAEMKGELKKRLNQLSKYDVLIIDKLGYLPITRQARYNLYEYRSIILTTNKDFTSWGESFHDDNVAVPIIGRVTHHSHIFMLGGESYRLKQKTGG